MKLGMFIIQRSPKYADELVFLPICSGCDKPITNFEEANLCPVPEATVDCFLLEDTVRAGKLDGAPLFYQPGEFGAYHWDCEPKTYPWKRLADVFKADQRPHVGELVTVNH